MQENGDGEIIVLVKRWAQWETGGEATQRLSSLLLFLNPLRHYAFNLSALCPLHPTFPTDIHSTLASYIHMYLAPCISNYSPMKIKE
jgi:hypothetical protein